MNLQSPSGLDRAGSVPRREARTECASWRKALTLHPLGSRLRLGTDRLARRAAPTLALVLLLVASASGESPQIAGSVTQLALMHSALIAQSPRADVSVTVT